ncbi:MAG TPA: CoB--CoM heterodisulfide reductase iron-sulfur subunit A family protein [Candidatus Acidoferrales bacterium]|nr:CoB--CoM heterodisulfide reductase iron-sulfur subunit A family protein [Candidatus Acidoferrales bacterium]
MTTNKLNVDTLVVGGGIAGMQSALDLADQGYKVALVEKNPSVGGKMIGLSKVFPTLDCCSCITTPKMSAVAHHDNIELLTYCEVRSVARNGDTFAVQITKKPRYVNEDDCTGCRACELVCPLELPDNENEFGRIGRRVIYVPFATAVPQKAVIDIDHCVFCGKCIPACAPNVIDFHQKPEEIEVEAKTIILATGYETTPRNAKKEYGSGKFRNVIDGLMMERLLSPTGPYGHVVRPSDGKQPSSIAYVQCAGSRDQTLGVPYCSRVCCMYAIKQAMLLSGTLPMADITIYYMDIRTFGKGYEQFYQSAKAMGIEFVKAKVARISEDSDQSLVVRVEMIDDNSHLIERRHDLVVLSVGMLPGSNAEKIFGVAPAYDCFVEIPDCNIAPTVTPQSGVFAAGTATGPMDIVDSIMTAGAAAAEAAAFIEANFSEKVISGSLANV